MYVHVCNYGVLGLPSVYYAFTCILVFLQLLEPWTGALCIKYAFTSFSVWPPAQCFCVDPLAAVQCAWLTDRVRLETGSDSHIESNVSKGFREFQRICTCTYPCLWLYKFAILCMGGMYMYVAVYFLFIVFDCVTEILSPYNFA